MMFVCTELSNNSFASTCDLGGAQGIPPFQNGEPGTFIRHGFHCAGDRSLRYLYTVSFVANPLALYTGRGPTPPCKLLASLCFPCRPCAAADALESDLAFNSIGLGIGPRCVDPNSRKPYTVEHVFSEIL